MDTIFSGFNFFIGIVLTIVLIVILYVKIIPKKFDGSFSNKFLQIIHDYFNFKKLYLESVLKFLFTLLTVFCIVAGIVFILSSFFGIFQSIEYIIKYDMSLNHLVARFVRGMLSGIAIIIFGTISIRLVYEGIMMLILLVKNVIEINNKLKDTNQN